MPDLENKPTRSDQFIMYVPTEKLEEILTNAMLSEDEPFPSQAQAAAEELARRQTEAEQDEARAAWNRFLAEREQSDCVFDDCIPDRATQPSGTGKTGRAGSVRSMGRIALIAAAALVLLALGAYAAGLNVFGLFARWSEEHLRFPAAAEETAENASAYDELMYELDCYTSAHLLVPTYLPVGFTLETVSSSTQGDVGICITALCNNGNEHLILSYRSAQARQVEYPKDGSNPERIEQGGVCYYIYTNENRFSATWTNAGFECSISGLSDKDELIRIVRSIDAKE